MSFHRIAIKATKLRRRTRGARSHYIIYQCPRCGWWTMSTYRIRHTYKSLRNWLRKDLKLKQFFSKKSMENFLAGKEELGDSNSPH